MLQAGPLRRPRGGAENYRKVRHMLHRRLQAIPSKEGVLGLRQPLNVLPNGMASNRLLEEGCVAPDVGAKSLDVLVLPLMGKAVEEHGVALRLGAEVQAVVQLRFWMLLWVSSVPKREVLGSPLRELLWGSHSTLDISHTQGCSAHGREGLQLPAQESLYRVSTRQSPCEVADQPHGQERLGSH